MPDQETTNSERGKGQHRSFNQRHKSHPANMKTKENNDGKPQNLREDFPSSFQNREEAEKHLKDRDYRIGWLRAHYQNGISYDGALHTLVELELLDVDALFTVFLNAHIALF